MSNIGHDEMKELLKEYEENPFDPAKKVPADIMRIFFQFNTPIVPVISRRNILLGVITKEMMTAEMSDIARFSGVPIDRFVGKVAQKMTFDEVLPFVSEHRDFTVINLFGEVMGSWTRMQLLAACEGMPAETKEIEVEAENQREEQQIQWMVYHVLEHIPRPLYAVNAAGKTVFYNSYFEDICLNGSDRAEVDLNAVEKSFSTPSQNDYFYDESGSGEMYFRNKTLGVSYEKIPMKGSADETNGYLYYFGRDINKNEGSGQMLRDGETLAHLLEKTERDCIVDAISRFDSLEKAAKHLGLTKTALDGKIKKLGIRPPDKKS